MVVGVDDPEPAANDVTGTQRGAVAEPQIGAEVEHDPQATLLDTPRLGERRSELERLVDSREGLEELGDHSRALRVTAGGRIEHGRRADGDPRGAVGGAGGRPPTGAGDQDNG